MTNRKGTKSALLMSVLSLLLCFSMLVGTTFAWFTDSVTSANNIIKSGTLEIGMYWAKGTEEVPALDPKDTAWTNAGSGAMFTKDQIWEPGYVDVKHIMIANQGTLALKYALRIVANGEVSILADVIDVYFIDPAVKVEGRSALTDENKLGTLTKVLSDIESGELGAGTLDAGKAVAVTLAFKMQEGASNDYQDKSIGSDFTIKLLATQATSESDSFNDQYDADATTYEPWDGTTDTAWYTGDKTEYTLVSAEQLAGLRELVNAGNDFADITVKLGTDVDLLNKDWTPIGVSGAPFAGTFDGNGYVIANLNVTGEAYVGLFGQVGDAIGGDFGSIYNVIIEGATVTGTHYVGAVVGGGYLELNSLAGCVVSNATIVCNVDSNNDNGDKAGVIAGYILNANVYNNKAINSSVYAYRDLGGIVGGLSAENYDVSAYGNVVQNVTLNYVSCDSYADTKKKNSNMGDFAGRLVDAGKTASLGENSGEATKNETPVYADLMITSVEDLVAFAKDVNGGNNYKGKTVLLAGNLDLANAEWTPIGTSSNNFKGTFDGGNHTISNLYISGYSSTVGLFGKTTEGEVKNLTVHNAKVSGRLNVGVVAGDPYTSKYTNITLTGHVEVNGMCYVGGVGGKNAYTDWTDITVNVDETSYVKAYSIENDAAYRSYVGGVVGFMGEGAHTMKNVNSNIDVIGSTCDVGGIVGIAHYQNKFINCSSSGNISITDAAEAGDVEEMGGIAGVWHNENGTTVTFENCSFTGTLTANFTEGVDLSDNTITGKAYNTDGTGELIIK